MTAVNATARISNLEMSLNKYVKDNLGTTEGLSIDFRGMPFDDTATSEWIRPRIVNAVPIYWRKGASGQYAEQVDTLYQIDIFVKKSGITVAHRLMQLRDTVAYYFRIGEDIDVRNYAASGTTYLGNLRIREVATDAEGPEDEVLYHYAIAWAMQWDRLTDVP